MCPDTHSKILRSDERNEPNGPPDLGVLTLNSGMIPILVAKGTRSFAFSPVRSWSRNWMFDEKHSSHGPMELLKPT